MSEQSPRPTEKIPITSETREWMPGLDASLPIRGEDIPGFVAWVNGNGFLPTLIPQEGGYPPILEHSGFDFGAYLRDDGMIVLGLPPDIPVRAVADGIIPDYVQTDGPCDYYSNVHIAHGAPNSRMFSSYVHINPKRKPGPVRKGDVLGTLYKGPGSDEGPLVHLHLELTDIVETRDRNQRLTGRREDRHKDPRLIDPSIYKYTLPQQGWTPITNAEVPSWARGIEVAHFRTVRLASNKQTGESVTHEWHQ